MIEQAGIVVFGVMAVWLSQDGRENVRRWACIAGLCAQPFWLYTTWKAQQWGIFGVSILYAWGWFRGLRNHWL